MHIPFRPIARMLVSTLRPTPEVDTTAIRTLLSNLAHSDQGQGAVITVNHYSAPDFRAWWLSIVISAVIPQAIHWIVTSGWTNSGWLTPITHWLFPRGARLFGFTPMPAMPPDPSETEKRALAVRQVLRYASQTPQPVIGISPEGRDIPGGALGSLPSGVGRFIHLICRRCPNVIPAGVWKENNGIRLQFGAPYQLELPEGLSTHMVDHQVGMLIMHHIAGCLPERLRGEYR